MFSVFARENLYVLHIYKGKPPCSPYFAQGNHVFLGIYIGFLKIVIKENLCLLQRQTFAFF